MLALDYLHLGPALLMQSLLQLGPSSSAYGMQRLDLTLLALDLFHLGLLMLSRSHA